MGFTQMKARVTAPERRVAGLRAMPTQRVALRETREKNPAASAVQKPEEIDFPGSVAERDEMAPESGEDRPVRVT